MKNNILETVVGFIVIMISILCVLYVYYSSTNHNTNKEYYVKARFNNVEGIIVGSDVIISGIKVGNVENVVLDTTLYDVTATLKIKDDIKIPTNSSISIVSNSIIGDKYMVINPGSSKEFLKSGEEIIRTQSSINLESLIGQLIYSFQ